MQPASQQNTHSLMSLGLWNSFTSPITLFFKSFFPDQSSIQPSILILPKDVMNHIFINIDEEADLCAFRITCTTLSRMQLLPNIQVRIFSFKWRENVGTELVQAVLRKCLLVTELRLKDPEGILGGKTLVEANNDPAMIIDTLFKQLKEKFPLFEITNENLNSIAMNILQTLKRKSRSENFLYKERINLEGGLVHLFLIEFKKNMYNIGVDAYANHPIRMITPASFKAKAEKLRSYLPSYSTVSVINSLRLAIKAAHGPVLTELANAYLNPSPNNPKIEELKSTLEIELKTSMTTSGNTNEQLYEIETNLTNIDAIAQMEAQKLGRFYQKILDAQP